MTSRKVTDFFLLEGRRQINLSLFLHEILRNGKWKSVKTDRIPPKQIANSAGWVSIMNCKIFCFTVTTLFSVSAQCAHPLMLVSTEQIARETSDLFYDGSINVDITGGGQADSSLNFSYSKTGPTSTCPDTEKCKPITKSVLTAYLDLEKSRIHINFICDSIVLYDEISHGMRDIFCGPNTRLTWNGKNYVQSESKP